nr:putative replication associated protein [Crucivirus sp.]
MSKAAPAKRDAPSKHFVFTWNDQEDKFTHAEVMKAFEGHCDYIVFQEEKGSEGTKHYQGYLEFTKALRFTAIHKMVPKGHHIFVEKRKGTRQQAREYAMKEDTRVNGPWEGGSKPWSDKMGKQGQRKDLDDLAALIKEGKSETQIFDEMPGPFLRYVSNIQKVRLLIKPTRTQDLVVALLYGPPGTGKSRCVRDTFPDVWAVPVGKDLWFTGYQGEPNVLIDDFAGNIGLTQLLQILDRYPVQLPAKGSHVWWCPTNICITTNCHPCNWYDYSKRQDSYKALKRRITNVFLFESEDKDQEEIEVDDFFENRKVVGLHWPEDNSTFVQNIKDF